MIARALRLTLEAALVAAFVAVMVSGFVVAAALCAPSL